MRNGFTVTGSGLVIHAERGDVIVDIPNFRQCLVL
jgi:hypothetical protein